MLRVALSSRRKDGIVVYEGWVETRKSTKVRVCHTRFGGRGTLGGGKSDK